MNLPPLSLYVHIPWCVRKCPYCDFNSHAAQGQLPEEPYINALVADLRHEATRQQGRPLHSVFIGGGTPSLFSAPAIDRILTEIDRTLGLPADIEITLEANPGAVDQQRFSEYRASGINRISLGVQSFDNAALKALGRIHNSDNAHDALRTIKKAGFERWNIDLMHGLPGQSVEAAMLDLKTAFQFEPSHLSWYQLTIEPNTAFYSNTPTLPDDDELATIQDAGVDLLAANGLKQYEVSAYAQPMQQCQHNLNYWGFGDYLAIGAGAHGKVSYAANDHLSVERYWKTRVPDTYISSLNKEADHRFVDGEDRIFEFMLNALRLNDGFSLGSFSERTGFSSERIQRPVQTLMDKGLLEHRKEHIAATAQGQRFLNDVIGHFLES